MGDNIVKKIRGHFVKQFASHTSEVSDISHPRRLTNYVSNLIIISRTRNTDLAALKNRLSTPRPMCQKASGGVIFFSQGCLMPAEPQVKRAVALGGVRGRFEGKEAISLKEGNKEGKIVK
jgi:hypothetical protein